MPGSDLEASTARALRRYGCAMSKWPKDWRPEKVKDAQRYLDAHENGAGDPDLIDECERMVDMGNPRPHHPTGPGGATQPSPFPKPPDDQMEEEGSD